MLVVGTEDLVSSWSDIGVLRLILFFEQVSVVEELLQKCLSPSFDVADGWQVCLEDSPVRVVVPRMEDDVEVVELFSDFHSVIPLGEVLILERVVSLDATPS